MATKYRLKRRTFSNMLQNTAGSALQAAGGVMDSGVGKVIGVVKGAGMFGVPGALLGGLGMSMLGKAVKQTGSDLRRM